MKAKKCIVCGTEFTPMRGIQRVCTSDCAIQYAIEKRDKERAKAEQMAARESRKVIKLQREKLKTRSDHAKEAQAAFNAYIRERDRDEPCISCGRYHSGQYHAGHYRPVGSHPELRYEELNVHKQCAPCNNHKSGNVVEYRINLREKIGDRALAWLEGPHETRKYTIEELQQIKSTYKQKLKELKDA